VFDVGLVAQKKIDASRQRVVTHHATIAGLNDVAQDSKVDHSTCRDNEDIALEEEIKECDGDVVEYWTAPKMPPCDAVRIEQIMDTRVWEEGWGATLDGHVTTCKAKQTAAAVYTKVTQGVNLCDGKQDVHEDNWCKLNAAEEKNCANLNTLTQDWTTELAAFKKHSHMIGSARKVLCFIDVIKAGASGVQLNGDKVQECVNLGYTQEPKPANVPVEQVTVNYAALPGSTEGDSIVLKMPSTNLECKEKNAKGGEAWQRYNLYSQKNGVKKNDRIQGRYSDPTAAC